MVNKRKNNKIERKLNTQGETSKYQKQKKGTGKLLLK